MTSTNTKVMVHTLSKIITDGDTLCSEVKAEGVLYKADDAYVIEYEDTQQACRTKVVVDAVSVCVIHTGSVQSTMLFKNDYVHKSSYGIEYGDMDMEVRTDRIFVEMNMQGGSIELWYELVLGGSVSNAKIIMEITKAEA